jgi:magnesium and cobalt transporter
MQKMTQEKEDPLQKFSSPHNGDANRLTVVGNGEREDNGVVSFIKSLIKPKNDPSSLRETIEEYIEDGASGSSEESISAHEKILISNILKIKNTTAADIMVPRADIIAISQETTQQELFALISEKQYSRLPVYTETLDNVIGSIHVKDILATLARGEEINMRTLVREVPIISPAMQLLDLLLQMRLTRKHMVLVVDEFGGIDGLITIGDVIEAIVGDIYDEHDPDDVAEIIEKADGTILADARVDLDEFEDLFGKILSENERHENDTLGGLVIYMAGRVPVRGEVITHDSGMIFEILDAGPRRVNRICIRNIPRFDNGDDI